MKIFKFGGASIKDPEAVRNVRRVINDFSDKKELLVVVSAMGKTTNKLEEILSAQQKGGDYATPMEELKAFHMDIANALFENKEATIFKRIEKIFYLLEQNLIATYEDADEHYDQIVSFGELLSSHIIAAYLNQENIPTQFIDARIYIQTNENWREGQVDLDWSEKMVKAELPPILENHVIITQGFIGGTISNKTTTLGREGSDYSAAIFGYCLDAEDVTIWKDVPGIMNADPKRVPEAILFDQLSYKFAAEMTYYGASVIHPKTIRPLAVKQIPLKVKSFIKPEDQGTIIGNFKSHTTQPAIIFKKKQSLITFEEKDFLNVNRANIASIFNELARHHVNINLMRNSALSIQICTDTRPVKFERVIHVLQDHFNITVEDGMELVTLRNYNEETIRQARLDSDEIMMEQKAEQNFQIVRRAVVLED
ncbi:aspartate kinase [Algivirga pacifica]|uniref:Aspartokinase n=1 Tax=Algivirga pacifica TaxID=1162670 RepID=A0ABP9DFS0_9BACT